MQGNVKAILGKISMNYWNGNEFVQFLIEDVLTISLSLLFYNNYLSISPKTISSEPIIAATSASMCPFAIKSKACKCAKPGALIRHL
ncbi:hypothetical protein TNCT_737301 [Trichonephila clavata]|uniref:Uncharacterized protein n=1 Tax=Trichonephila clavata TaxID=2740835 RepID=A0A8X6IRL6_TRICU|nr:hypothetical protein TNCT_737301 [Trichonephila clavata]